MAFDDKDNLMIKLDTIKEIRGRSLSLEKVKAKLLQDLQLIASEDKHIRKYQLELEALKRERQAHTDALAALATDIDLMENTVNGSQNARRKMSDLIGNVFQSEYQPLKDEIDYYRSMIGLNKLPEFPDEYKKFSSVIDPNTFPPASKSSGRSTENIDCTQPSGSDCWQQQPCSSSRRRQSQPPMKQCETCHQMIHRNAPVCPLCKAKSHSKHPKKARKKAS